MSEPTGRLMKCPGCKQVKHFELFPTSEGEFLDQPCKACRNYHILSGGEIDYEVNAKLYWTNQIK
jgi:hypothetical protein